LPRNRSMLVFVSHYASCRAYIYSPSILHLLFINIEQVFSKKPKVTTKLKHSAGLEAMAELGYKCNEDITETLAPDVR
jgi:hypothetical protein